MSLSDFLRFGMEKEDLIFGYDMPQEYDSRRVLCFRRFCVFGGSSLSLKPGRIFPMLIWVFLSIQ